MQKELGHYDVIREYSLVSTTLCTPRIHIKRLHREDWEKTMELREEKITLLRIDESGYLFLGGGYFFPGGGY